jgi:hypothetical protein
LVIRHHQVNLFILLADIKRLSLAGKTGEWFLLKKGSLHIDFYFDPPLNSILGDAPKIGVTSSGEPVTFEPTLAQLAEAPKVVISPKGFIPIAPQCAETRIYLNVPGFIKNMS